jgi:tetratricopeptide (TPR) repeat protein
MTTRYPDRTDFARFVRGELSAGDNRRIVQQLLAAFRDVPDEGIGADESEAEADHEIRRHSLEYRSLFAESAPGLTERAESLAAEREAAPALLARLLAWPAAERKSRIRRDRAFQTWALCERMVEECHRLTYEGTFEAEEMADLAVTVAEELDTTSYGPSLVQDIHGRAWAAVGSVLRVTSDLRSADEAFLMAEILVGQGSGDALEEAGVLELKAALRRDQRRLSEAHRLLDDVISIYRQYRDFHLVGRAFVQKGEIHGAVGELEQAVLWLRKGLSLIDPVRDRRLELAARHSLMLYLQESGRHQEAWFMLKATRGEFRQHGGELLNSRLRWLEGKIQQALGLTEEAEAALVEARRSFIAHGIGFDAALVSLDLASLYAQLGRAAEMRAIAEEMMPIFQSRDVHREAIAALIVFQQAVQMERVSSNLLREIGHYLQRARHDYKLRFDEQES